MKILIVNKFLYPNGGSETYIFKLGKELLNQGHEVQYFGMEHEGRIVGNHANSYTSNMDFHTGKLAKLAYPFKIIYSKEAYKKITTVLDDFKPDVVHLNNFNFQLTPSVIYAIRDWEKRRNTKCKIVYTAHDGQLVCPNHLMQQYISQERCDLCIKGSPMNCAKHKCIHGSTVKSLLGSLEAMIYRTKKTYSMIDLVICPSAFLKNRLDALPELRDKTVVMHNFVDANNNDALKNNSENVHDTINNHNIVDAHDAINTEKYILYLGRFSEEKGVKTLLKVCRELEKEAPDIAFKFAGNGPLEDEVNSLSNIENLGFLSGETLVNAISNAMFTIFPSECNENCPFTVIESQIYGTPIIAANVGGVPEVMKDLETGELFEPGDAKTLKAKILELYSDNDKLNRYRENCKKQKFADLEEYTEKFLELVKQDELTS